MKTTGRTLRLAPFLALIFLSGCVSHLREAKLHYSRAQELSRNYQTQSAVAAYRRVALEADLAARRNPSAQAFMLKGMAEVRLEQWAEAGESFLKAFSLGFESGEEWAADVSLLGLAVSFEELGLRDSAADTYANILARSRFRPVLMPAAQRHTDAVLSRSLELPEKERESLLAGQLKVIDRLLDRDFACGYYHYLFSQVLSHRGEHRRGYEEAVMARELGLPSVKILRDNDNQILFCYDKLEEALPSSEWKDFAGSHGAWTAKWGWKDARTPPWKEE